jgi:3-hydroxymyristoyl/3-hydroxydecanoyl-(acyl carrier protein) dehydratase
MADISGMRELEREKVLEQSGDRVVLEFVIVAESAYFDGHFPEFKLLPAVAQFELAVRMADRYFGTGINVARLRRIKFSTVVLPGTLIHMELHYREQKNEVAFTLMTPAKDITYSTGTFSPGPHP